MRRLGIVDLGSNTARLVVFGYEPELWFRLIDEIREPVRLGEGMGRGNALAPEAIERAVAALTLYTHFTDATSLGRPRVIATSALRDAVNAERFFERARHLELPIEVLSGEEEAALGVRAVANSFAFEDAWVMDLGGGSAQISEMRGRAWVKGRAYPLGAVRLTEAHLLHDPPRRPEVAELEAAAAAALGEVALAMRRRALPLVAMGGTIRNLARAVQKRRGYPLGRVHGYFLRAPDLAALTDDLLALPVDKRRRIGGIHPDRADVILAGCLVYRWLLAETARDGLWISGYGMREGAFLESFLPPPHLHPEVRAFSVENLFRGYPQPLRHTANVRRLARRIFDGMAPVHKLGPAEADLLDAAAWLHDIGMAVGYHKHHKHGAYLVETTHLLNGFTHREQALVMLLVRYHRKGSPSLGMWRELVRPGDKKLLLRLAACLRLAEYLERARAGRVKDVRVWIHRDTATLELTADEEPVVEMWEAMKHAAFFEQAFGRRLVLKRGSERPAAAPACGSETR